ncbi:AAA family ATPase [Kitasatospora sp. LaBMicrA B282]|uniref:AAA family ATPase n=1 Tax=Kitasatospora sp. LaBMicrA B282 TaxID=3420949 RepID=UPI003D0D1339
MSDTTPPPPMLLGRQDELRRCRAVLDAGGAAGVLLTGAAGIGKSAVLDALQTAAVRAGQLVLRSNPVAGEAELPHLALYDLFAGVLADPGRAPQPLPLAPALRESLDVALLRAPAAEAERAVDRLALSVAVLELLRLLAAAQPVLLLLDDAPFLDPASARVLAFAARRLGAARVRWVAAERVGGAGEPGSLGLLPDGASELALAPLPDADLRALLRARGGLAAGDPVAERIAAAGGGNPGCALELARAAQRWRTPIRAGDPLPVPRTLREQFAPLLARLSAESAEALLPSAAAALLPGAGPQVPLSAGTLAAGQAAGVLGASPSPGGRPCFTHPLLPELLYAGASPEQRRRSHALLAEQVADPLERARHRALAHPAADPTADPAAAAEVAEVAADLAAAAELAVDRGAPALAAELAQLAAERSAHDPELAADRLLLAARHALDAGRPAQARQACAAVLHGANRAARVGARLLLVELAGGDRAAVPALLAAAQVEAGDTPRLRTAVQLHRAEHALSTGRRDHGLAELAEAARDAERSGDLDRQLEVIALRAPTELQQRPGGVPPALRAATALAAGRCTAAPTAAAVQLRCCLVVGLLRTGSVTEAIEEVDRLRADVESAGRVRDLADVLHLVASVHERAGRCGTAFRAARRGGRLRRELGPTPAPGLVLSAAAELNGGTAARAAELAGPRCGRPRRPATPSGPPTPRACSGAPNWWRTGSRRRPRSWTAAAPCCAASGSGTPRSSWWTPTWPRPWPARARAPRPAGSSRRRRRRPSGWTAACSGSA